jgi:hypothetical protein
MEGRERIRGKFNLKWKKERGTSSKKNLGWMVVLLALVSRDINQKKMQMEL